MSATFPALSNPSGTRQLRRLRRRPEPTGAADLDLDALLASGAMEHTQRRRLRQTLTDLLTWLRIRGASAARNSSREGEAAGYGRRPMRKPTTPISGRDCTWAHTDGLIHPLQAGRLHEDAT